MSESSLVPWGRVDDDGTVYVRTRAGERSVGQWPGGDPTETLAFFSRRYDALELEVVLLEQRVRARRSTPDEATAAVRRLRTSIQEAQAVGDLDALLDRLDSLTEAIGQWRAERRAERQQELERVKERKEQLAAKAEQISAGTDWRGGANRLRDLLEEWKSLPRLERSVDDALWRRFSAARTAYTRRRKEHFAERSARQEQARADKEELVAEAEALADSTRWGAISGQMRQLMARWKAAGHAGKTDEDQLWARFRAAQDTFFSARDAANKIRTQEEAAKVQRMQELLAEAEALLPVTDARAARTGLRQIAERWEQVGTVRTAQARSLEGRLRAVEQAVRSADEGRWRKGTPEAHSRANAAVRQLESLIADLEQQLADAQARGDAATAQEAEEALTARRAWLDQARRTLEEFGATA